MSVRVMAKVWEYSQHGGSDLLMLLGIADFADDDGRAYPAVATLAAKCRVKPRAANYTLRALQDSGELDVRAGEGPKGTNLYRVAIERLGSKPAVGLQSVAGPQDSAPLQSIATLQPVAPGAAKDCSKPLQHVADKPPVNHQEPPKKKEKVNRSVDVDVPPWMPADKWKDFIDHRLGMRNGTFSSAARKLLIKEIEKLRDQGHDPASLLDLSIMNGWKSVYAPRPVTAPKASSETPWAREARQRVEQVSTRIAAKNGANDPFTIDAEVPHAANRLG